MLFYSEVVEQCGNRREFFFFNLIFLFFFVDAFSLVSLAAVSTNRILLLFQLDKLWWLCVATIRTKKNTNWTSRVSQQSMYSIYVGTIDTGPFAKYIIHMTLTTIICYIRPSFRPHIHARIKVNLCPVQRTMRGVKMATNLKIYKTNKINMQTTANIVCAMYI